MIPFDNIQFEGDSKPEKIREILKYVKEFLEGYMEDGYDMEVTISPEYNDMTFTFKARSVIDAKTVQTEQMYVSIESEYKGEYYGVVRNNATAEEHEIVVPKEQFEKITVPELIIIGLQTLQTYSDPIVKGWEPPSEDNVQLTVYSTIAKELEAEYLGNGKIILRVPDFKENKYNLPVFNVLYREGFDESEDGMLS